MVHLTARPQTDDDYEQDHNISSSSTTYLHCGLRSSSRCPARPGYTISEVSSARQLSFLTCFLLHFQAGPLRLRLGDELALRSRHVFPEIGDRDNLEAPGARKAPAVVSARHVALRGRGVDELTEETDGGLAGEVAQVWECQYG